MHISNIRPVLGTVVFLAASALAASPARALEPNVCPAQTFSSTDTPKPIPDWVSEGTGVSSTIPVSGVGTLGDVDVRVNITHATAGDLKISLTAPGGRTITLVDHQDASGADFTNTVFDDEAGAPLAHNQAPHTDSFKPKEQLSAFDGRNANGTWTLTVLDGGAPTDGTLNSWSLSAGRSCPPPPPPPAPPAPPPPPPPPPLGPSGPVVKRLQFALTGASTQRPLRNNRGLAVRLSCPKEDCVVTVGGTITVPAAKAGGKATTVKLKSRSVKVKKAKSTTVTFKLPKTLRDKIARALGSARTRLKVKASMTATATAVDEAGNDRTSKKKKTIKIRR